jgi:predicted nucleotidyltransferase
MRGPAIEVRQGGAKLEHGQIGLPGGLAPERLIERAARHGARNVRVFGSVARGTAANNSDLDLLVDMEPGRDLVALKRELEETLGLKVDVLTENSSHPTCARGSCAKRSRSERGPA